MNLGDDLDRAMRDVSVDGDNATATLKFTGDEAFFEGHFPDGPVLPAVVQISASVRLAGRVAGRELRLAEVTRAKFTNPTGSGRELTLSIETEPHDDRLRVKSRLTEGDVEIAEFTLRVL